MRRYGRYWIALGAFALLAGFAKAQSSLDALDEELKEASQQHQDLTSQLMTNFFGQLSAAMNSPDAAIALYQQAGGDLPPPSPVETEHINETETEKEAREARDKANLDRLGLVLQLHCGVMNFAALFIVNPKQKGLQDDWVAWLQKAAQMYPQLVVPATTDNPAAPQQQTERKRRYGGGGGGPAPTETRRPFNPEELKQKAMVDSIISKYLGFKSWQDKEQGTWAVKDLPKLYRTNVLDPLRTTPTAATLAAWDAYIAMASSDEKDDDQWNQIDYPPLQFGRACDDYVIQPGTDKLEGLVSLIKANPTFPGVDDWIAKVHQFMSDYRASHGGTPVAMQNTTPTPPPTDPNVSITTQQQGDATIIITHTNSPPANQ